MTDNSLKRGWLKRQADKIDSESCFWCGVTRAEAQVAGGVDELTKVKALLAEIGNIANGIRAIDGSPDGYCPDYFNRLVDSIHDACGGDTLTYSWKHPVTPYLQPKPSEDL